MKTLAKIVGVVGRGSSLVWAMRDRFISVAASQTSRRAAGRDPGCDGPGHRCHRRDRSVFASRLKNSGIDDVSKLAAATPDTIAEAAESAAPEPDLDRTGPLAGLKVPYLHQPEDLGDLLEGEPSYRVDQLRKWLYRTPVLSNTDMTNLPAGGGAGWSLFGHSRWKPSSPQMADHPQVVVSSTRRSRHRGRSHGLSRRATLCISSQAGCALGCTFCATGQFGFERHLDAGEIMAQVAYAQAFLRQIGMPGTPGHLTNVVFMGMGEPLANYDRVQEALRRMIEVMGLSARSITVSTVGMVPGITTTRRRALGGLARGQPPRSRRRAPQHSSSRSTSATLAEIEEAAAGYFEKKRRRLSIEWTMMEDVNDTADQAVKLAAIARRLHAHVNLIALNPTPLTKEKASSETVIHSFARQLRRLRDQRHRPRHQGPDNRRCLRPTTTARRKTRSETPCLTDEIRFS